MMKEPRPGRVKTRLARGIGPVEATWWYRHQSARLVRQVGHDRRWQTWLAVAPDHALTSRSLPCGAMRIAQGRGDLGARMARMFAAMPPGPSVLIGSDIPDIDRSAIDAAFDALRKHDAVFGPAPDGGYWLIGLSAGVRPGIGFLQDVQWSSQSALADSKASLGRYTRLATTQTLQDVDTIADLACLRRSGFPNKPYRIGSV